MKYFATIALGLLMSCSQNDPSPKWESPPIKVVTTTVMQRNVPICCSVIGHTEAFQDVAISPHVSGELLRNHVSDGESVKKGDLLYSIDPRPYQAKLNQTKAKLDKDFASLKLAEKKVERYRDLLKKEFISQMQFEELQTDVDLAKGEIALDEAAIALAQIELDYCEIHSPIDGKMSANHYDPGNWIGPSDATPINWVRKLDPLVVHFHLPQKDYQMMGQKETLQVELVLPEKPEQKHLGVVYFVDNTFDKQTGTIFLKAKVPNPDESLWPGEFVQVRLILKTETNALLLPKGAISSGQKGEYVYIVREDDTVEKRTVRLGQRNGNDVVIQEGVSAHDRVVLEGQLKLREGARITSS